MRQESKRLGAPAWRLLAMLVVAVSLALPAIGAKKADAPRPTKAEASMEWPPKLPNGADVVTDTSGDMLAVPSYVQLQDGVQIAKEPPTIDFAFFQGQTEYAKLWSDWGDSSTAGTKYYTSIGDHSAPRGRSQCYEYDSATKKLRLLMDVKEFLEKTPGALPEGMDYTPGKVHSRTDIGSDGWVYFSTHRGSTSGNTDDKHGYLGDWIFRVNPETGKQEIAAAYPMPKHTIPASVLDPERLIYYGGTASGNDSKDAGVWFIAYDVKNNKLLKKEPGGFGRYCILSSSTGRVYWQAGKARAEDEGAGGSGRKYDPKTNEITNCPGAPNVRAATRETKDGIVYGFTQGNTKIWAFDVKTEKAQELGEAMIGGKEVAGKDGSKEIQTESYVATADLDPVTERYVYYSPGAHGSGRLAGTPIVQYDVKTKTRKVIAFVADYYARKYGWMPIGTFGCAISPDGKILFVTWNGTRNLTNAKGWDTCGMMAIHIPESERQP